MTDSTLSMHNIVGWPSEVGLSTITMLQFPLSLEMAAAWTQSLRNGVSERQQTLQTLRHEQQKEHLQSTEDQAGTAWTDQVSVKLNAFSARLWRKRQCS